MSKGLKADEMFDGFCKAVLEANKKRSLDSH